MNMHGPLLMILAMTAAATATDPAPDVVATRTDHARIEIASFHSRILKRRKSFAVVLPEGYAAATGAWPVLFLFHGRGRHERSLIDAPKARQALLQSRALVILPDGDDGWYINSPVREQDRYRDYTEEVIAAADAHYRTSSNAAKRGLSGWSMGGYGCVLYAQSHADRFSAVAPMIGLLDFPRTGLSEPFSYDVPVQRFGDNPETWTALNPLHHADKLRGMAVYIVTADRAFDRIMNETFSRKLNELSIAHTIDMLQGGHTFDIVQQALPRVIRFMNMHWQTED